MTCPWSILVRTAPFLVGLFPVATAFRQKSPMAAKALGLVATGGMGIATYYQIKTFFSPSIANAAAAPETTNTTPHAENNDVASPVSDVLASSKNTPNQTS
eukprot:TRINITY_DN1117_c0_g1_i1.p1 TRINITY_DN1117_c0_g1~~TRINITY_DN1117_c0_g1_i1.p1  ORF type:complete len:101 (+),score=29.18 TRINITY_DN1117_c0_g1_i1:49-351(+)